MSRFLQFEADRSCPLCGGDDKVVLSRKMQFRLDCTTVVCRQCGLCFVSPAPTREAYASFYRDAYAHYYRKIHPATNDASVVPLRESEWERYRLDLIEGLKTLQGSRVLEIGPGRGRFLRLVKQRGAITCAIEPSADFRDSLQKAGIEVIGNFLEDTATARQFDVVMLFQVLEHFHEPGDALRRIKGLLAPDGIVVLDVPNIWKPFRSLDRYFLRYVHLSYFSPHTLQRLFAMAGFAPLYIDEGGHGIRSPIPIFAVFRDGESDVGDVTAYRDDWVALIDHLKRYRRSYAVLHAPRFHAWMFVRGARRLVARSLIGRAYRYVKSLRSRET